MILVSSDEMNLASVIQKGVHHIAGEITTLYLEQIILYNPYLVWLGSIRASVSHTKRCCFFPVQYWMVSYSSPYN